ncbi:intermembrane phospholipid transport protein YdbH family protein [Henriciella marina]|uniref:intermembrane phospholipid transport protein YdbH family protein n=1 Tax=Henriciella marina TaxID=453851 RepID=UPI0014616B8E|nr:YdbH domain-containing protein [Henriciella marina]
MTGVCAVLGLILLALCLAWLFRQSILGQVAKSWCQSNELECIFEIDRVSFSGAELSQVSITNRQGKTPIEADEIDVELDWPSAFMPSVRAVRAERPVLRAEYTSEGNFEFGGLEDIGNGRSNNNANIEIPDISVKDARIELMTPAGQINLTGDVSGELPFQAEIHARIEPVELNTEDGQLVVEEGRADITLVGATLRGSARLNVRTARFETLEASDIVIDAEMAQSLRPRVDWKIAAGELQSDAFFARAIDASGTVGVMMGESEDDDAGPLGLIRSISLSGDTGLLRWQTYEAEQTSVTLDASRKGGSDLTGDFAMEAQGLASDTVLADEMTLSGEGTLSDNLDLASIDGDFTASGASIPEDVRNQLLAAVQSGPPFSGHGAALRSGFDAALQAFKTGAGYSFRLKEDASWSLASNGNLAVSAANGARLALAQVESQPAVSISCEGITLGGILSMSGPSLPTLTADVQQATINGDGIGIDAGGIDLSPWTASGLTLSSELGQLNVSNSSGEPRIRTVGSATVSGRLFGQDFAPTTIFGGVDALIADSLRVQSYSTRCIGIDSGGFSAPDSLRVGGFISELCPTDGRLVRRANGALTGELSIAELSIPFESNDTSGTLSFRDALLDWRAASSASVSLTGEEMTASMQIGDNSLEISAAEPELGFRTSAPLELSARTGSAEFSGTLVPAIIDLDALVFDATLPQSGLLGSATARNVVVRDHREDPFYQPLRGDLSATFGNGLMQLTGPVRTDRADRTVGDINMTLDLVNLDGEASVRTRDLVFQPGGFQPTALSERVRGLLSNARGTLNAGASFLIDGGDVSGTGFVEVENFGFDTLRIGAVNDVNGRVDFDRLLDLHTPPGQTVRLGEINPGLPLRDGEIRFQVLGADTAVIERAVWPFAGGELIVGRSEWTIAGTSDIVEITASELELSEIINVFQLPDISANGTVSGTFPVELEGPNVFIRDAVLRADEEGGTIAYTGDVADAASQADERVDMAFRALRNFEFSVLEVGANGNLTGGMMITLELVGISPDVLGGAPFAFNIGVDSELTKLVQAGRRVTGTDWLAEVATQSRNGDSAEGSDEEAAPETE